jgi:hypothetical protein
VRRCGPYPANDLDQPPTKAWTHRSRHEGHTDCELFDQLVGAWLWAVTPDRLHLTYAMLARRTSMW